MDGEQAGFSQADLKQLCKSYMDYTRANMDKKTVRRMNKHRVAMEKFAFQFSSDVVGFSSQYGSEISISYTASNLTGRPSKFPNYGDFPQCYVMRTYGPWKELAPSRKCLIMPQNAEKIKSDDYIILSFQTPVIPLVISIFETFTPGSVVRITGKAVDFPYTWRLLWEGLPQNCNDLKLSRLFAPKLKFIKEKINEICIEFNHSQLNYYTELDAVCLGGILDYPEDGDIEFLSIPIIPIITHPSSGYFYDNNEIDGPIRRKLLSAVGGPSIASDIPVSTSFDPFMNLIKNIEELENEWRKVPNVDYILQLPDESLMHIFSYLDFKSLRLCMRVCKRFHNVCTDSYFYRELNLKPYWSSLSPSMLLSLEPYCSQITKLDLSWCGITKQILTETFYEFIKASGSTLTHLRLDTCGFINDTSIIAISLFCKSIKELSLRSCSSINFEFVYPQRFPEMERFDLYRTNITNVCIESYLIFMPKLKHLNLGSCKKIEHMDSVAHVLSMSNQELVSLDVWKSYSLSPTGLRFLTSLKQLEEIDLGWCLAMSIPGDSLLALVQSCSKLKKIVVVSLRGMCDRDLIAFADYCPLLEQVDLVGLRAITPEACSKFLEKSKNLKLVDVNFCENIKEVDVLDWRCKYPNVCIQFSSAHANVYHY